MTMTQNSTVDLHMHSIYSDGTEELSSLLETVRKRGVRTFSLTDHDTIEGALLLEKMVPRDMKFIRGIEFSSVCRLGKIHILGYHYDPQQSTFKALVDKCTRIRMDKMRSRIRSLDEKYGIELTEEERSWLWSQARPGKPHLAQILINRGLAGSVEEAMNTYLKGITGESEIILPEEAVRAINESGGISVWAHPFWEKVGSFYPKELVEAQFSRLSRAGIRGMECWYSLYSREQTDYLINLAQRSGMLISGGSDYHGTRKKQKVGELNSFGYSVKPEDLTVLQAVGIVRA